MRYGLNGSNPLWRLYWLLGSAIFSWQKKFHSLADLCRRMGIVCAIRKAQIEPGMFVVCSLYCPSYYKAGIQYNRARLCF